MKRILMLICLLCGICHTLYAQEDVIEIQGSVMDAFLETGIKDCKIHLLRADSTEVNIEPQVYEIGHDAMHFSTYYIFKNMPRKPTTYLVHVEKEGYDDGWARVNIPTDYRDGILKAPDISMRRAMRSKTLGQVVVKATRVKVKMRGDTLVYDASAFNMPEGSLLTHLIQQLPGAELTAEGEIYVNGRKIDELMLNARSLFKGNKKVLLENLPYFTVKELAVFERPTLQSVLSGAEDEKKDYIMDVRLKDKFSLGIVANATAGIGTHNRFMDRLFGFFMSKTMTVGAYANLNNINDLSAAYASGSAWGVQQGLILGSANAPTRRQGGGVCIDYQSKRKIQYGLAETASYTTVKYDRYNTNEHTKTYKEFFLPLGVNYERTERALGLKTTSFQVDQHFHYYRWGLQGNFLLTYLNKRDDERSGLFRWTDTEATSSQTTHRIGRIKSYGLPWFHFDFPLPIYKRVHCFLDANWYREDGEGFYKQNSQATESSDYRHEYQDSYATGYGVEPQLFFQQTLGPSWKWSVKASYRQEGERKKNRLYALNRLEGWGPQDSVSVTMIPSSKDLLFRAYDMQNSDYSNLTKRENTVTLEFKRSRNERLPFDFTFTLPFMVRDERLTYLRDVIDTLAQRTRFVFNPTLAIKNDNITFRAGMQTSSPGMMNLMAYRDARNPLSIIEGNPHLKDQQSVDMSFGWHRGQGVGLKKGATQGLSTSFRYAVRSVAQGFSYNTETGAYTYRPENVKGNWTWNVAYNNSLPLDKDQIWWWDNQVLNTVVHSVDYASVGGSLNARLNRVENVNLSEGFKLRYIGKFLKLNVLGDICWRRSWGHSSDISISAFDYNYGFNGSYTWNALKLTLGMDVMMHSRRGYSSAMMNKDEPVVNASISRSLCKGKVNLELEAHDLFHQISNTAYEVNAQGRTETWHSVTPNYIMLSASYRFNVKGK